MKTTDFINENFVADAAEAHQDHEVQMARSDCYNAAKYAIELHKLLKNISEQQGLDGWVSEKITLANDYLRTVTEYLRYEQQSGSTSDMPEFNISSATQTLDSVLGEGQEAPGENGFFTWYLKKDGQLITPYTSDKPYTFKSKEEAIKWAKEKFKVSYDQGKIFPTANPEANLSPTVGPITSYVGVKEDDEEPQQKRKPAVVKTNKEIGSRVADIGPGGKEYNVKTDKAWDDQHKEVDEGKADPVGSWVVYNGSNVKRFKTRDGAKAYAEKMGGKVASSEFYADNVQKQGVAEKKGHGEIDPLAARADYAKRHGTGQVYKKTYPGDKDGMSKAYAYDIKRTGPKGVLPEEDIAEGEQRMSRAAKGNEKYGKDGMKELAKAGREGASEKELDAIRDRHDKYDEDLSEEAKKGLYYYVNKRKKAGTSRDADHPKAPTPQAWKDAAKTAKKESVAETTSSGSVATSMGGGNGFANGGPGTIARPRMKKKK